MKELITEKKKENPNGPKKLTKEDLDKAKDGIENLKKEYIETEKSVKDKEKLNNERQTRLIHEVKQLELKKKEKENEY